jgi:radical SAM superfamily enzyme YgiQ (UPF0313 family)
VISKTSQKKYAFETGIYRPPSEGGSYSLLVRITRNCPWNRCGFCRLYKGKEFSLRSIEEVKSDIDSIRALCEDLKAISLEDGYGGEINYIVATKLMEKAPEFTTDYALVMVYNWLASGGKTAFLQDADCMILPTDKLVDIIKYLRQTFPSLERVTSYARSKTLSRKKLEGLVKIRETGLDRLHVGLESGDDGVLKRIQKGVTSEAQVSGGIKAKEAGFQLSEYWIPGLGGKEMSIEHVNNTAKALNEINPDYIRTRPFLAMQGTPLYKAYIEGTFHPLTPYEQLMEIKMFIEALRVTSKVCFDHNTNCWRNNRGELLFSQSYEGYSFPDDKVKVLDLIEEGLKTAYNSSISQDMP